MFSNLMPKIKVLCIVLPGMDFGMSYDVSANMVEAVFTTIQTSAKTKSLPDNDDDGYHYCHAFVTIFK